MRTLYIAYNYLTLVKAYYHAKWVYTDGDATLVYRETVSSFPRCNLEELPFSVCILDTSLSKGFSGGLSEVLQTRSLISQTVELVRSFECCGQERCRLVIFKDTSAIEASILEFLQHGKKTGCRWEVVLIEEGTALYAPLSHGGLSFKKRVKAAILRTPHSAMLDGPDGLHAMVGTIICSSPAALQKRGGVSSKTVLREPEYFERSKCSEYIKGLFPTVKDDVLAVESAKFVFFTQPLVGMYGVTWDRFEAVFRQSIEHLLHYGNVLIKRHPRDVYDYAFIADLEGISFFPESLKGLPAELLLPFWEKAILVTFSSSVIMTGCAKEKFLLYRLLESDEMTRQFDEIFSQTTATIIGGFEELAERLNCEVD